MHIYFMQIPMNVNYLLMTVTGRVMHYAITILEVLVVFAERDFKAMEPIVKVRITLYLNA